jgi:predicted flap endonuclease-1-like 5' DNA nuclease
MFEILATLANSSLPIVNIPATLTPMLGNQTSTVLDATGITGVIGLGTALLAAYRDHQGQKTAENRSQALVNTQATTVNSLKASDQAAKDDAAGLNALTMKLCENPDIAKLLNEPTNAEHGINGQPVADFIKTQATGWDTSNKQYYDSSHPMPGDTSKDPVVAQAASIAKSTVPTPT